MGERAGTLLFVSCFSRSDERANIAGMMDVLNMN